MTYIVTDPCIKCKYMDCVEVCPVDCFYEGENFLVINPDECIDCGVCEPECPVDAIKPDTEDDPDGKWLKVNTDFAKVWPNITLKGEPPADADDFERETGQVRTILQRQARQGLLRRPRTRANRARSAARYKPFNRADFCARSPATSGQASSCSTS